MNTKELLWKYVDGSCSQHEISTIEKRLADDPSLQAELDNILEVQSVLISMETEAPSMRFAQNVLDALPDIYPSEVTEPLVKPIWKKVFWVAVAALLVSAFLLPRSVQPSGSFVSPYLDQLASGIYDVVGQVPDMVLQYFVLTLLSLCMLMLVDKMFLKRVKGLYMI